MVAGWLRNSYGVVYGVVAGWSKGGYGIVMGWLQVLMGMITR